MAKPPRSGRAAPGVVRHRPPRRAAPSERVTAGAWAADRLSHGTPAVRRPEPARRVEGRHRRHDPGPVPGPVTRAGREGGEAPDTTPPPTAATVRGEGPFAPDGFPAHG
ncbi:hypothetical protein Sgou_06780 [Streptomyces gougerotii]|uniref:Uncharacterized protein n=1 Tax=Streptomyces gougerotii TaxID=53448 RepID=A0A8H9HT62_9ACTN|nr:hypothetical protein Sgou_06780 [Streptomyces gougerotii]GGU86841.1 hypothetical protein GCM10010227_46750 [Streptomyces gougerotii]